MAKGRFTVDAVFRAVDRFSKPIRKMERKLKTFARNAAFSFGKASKSLGKFLGGVGRVAKRLAILGAAAGFVAFKMLKVGADFEQAITDVGAVGLRTRDQIQGLEDQAKELGATTKFTAVEAANAMEILARAGFNVKQTMTAVPAVLNAAAASGLELAEVADVMSNVLKGMGLAMEDSTRVADVLALASAKTNSTIGSLGESMRRAGPKARQLGVSLEETVASVALLQDVGIEASVAGSAFNRMLTKLAKPTTEIKKKMKEFGISFRDSSGDMLSFNKVIENIAIAADKSGGNLDKVAFIADLVGLRGEQAASNLAKLFQEDKLTDLQELLLGAAGSAERMAEIRMDTLIGDLTKLGSGLNNLRVDIFESAGGLREIVQAMTEWVRENKALILVQTTAFFKFIRDVGPSVLSFFKNLAITVGLLSTIFVSLKIATFGATIAAKGLSAALLANPIGLLVAGVALLVFFWDDIVGIWKEAKLSWDNLWSGVITKLNKISPILGTIAKLIKFIVGIPFFGLGQGIEALAGGLGLGPEKVRFAPGKQAGRLDNFLQGPQSTTAPVLSSPGPAEQFEESLNITVSAEDGTTARVSKPKRRGTKVRTRSNGGFASFGFLKERGG